MALARVEEFINTLRPLTKIKEIKIVCNNELDYLRRELGIKTKYNPQGYPVGVDGDARRLKTQVSAYRKAIEELPTNSRNSVAKVKNGAKIRIHKALKYFNLADHEKQDVNERDRARVRMDKTNRPSFDAVAVIEQSFELLHSDSYVSKVAGLYLLTGRRHEEILITGRFDQPYFYKNDSTLIREWLINDIDCALFSGQVKRKFNDDIPYMIPILAPLEVIQNSIQWLRVNKPHTINQRPKGSKELGLKVRKEYQGNGLLPIPAGKDNYLNPHNLRSAYSAICWQLYRNSDVSLNCTEDLFIKAIISSSDNHL